MGTLGSSAYVLMLTRPIDGGTNVNMANGQQCSSNEHWRKRGHSQWVMATLMRTCPMSNSAVENTAYGQRGANATHS